MDAVWGGEREGQFWGKYGASYCYQRGLCGVVIFCRDGWRRGSSQITLGFLVISPHRLHYC